MRSVGQASRFRSDYRKLASSGRYDLEEMMALIERLAVDEPLDPRHRDHALSGRWKGYRECHIKPDWLLIYKLEPGRLVLVRTGSHSDLFG